MYPVLMDDSDRPFRFGVYAGENWRMTPYPSQKACVAAGKMALSLSARKKSMGPFVAAKWASYMSLKVTNLDANSPFSFECNAQRTPVFSESTIAMYKTPPTPAMVDCLMST
jgi:hypothetical protein